MDSPHRNRGDPPSMRVKGNAYARSSEIRITSAANTDQQSSARGNPIREPYALNFNTTFARYDVKGREKPTVFLSKKGASPAGMQGVICIGHGSDSVNPAYKLSTDSDGSFKNPIVLSTAENDMMSISPQIHKPGKESELYHARQIGRLIKEKNKQPNQMRHKRKRPMTAATCMTSPERTDTRPVPLEAPPETTTTGKTPIDARGTSSTLEILEKNHAEKLANYFCQLYMHDQLTDFLVHVGSYSFSAHKTVLCCFSPHLAKAILQAPESKELYLGDTITPTGFKKILDYMYTKELSIEVENLAEILQAATILGMPELNERCMAILDTATTASLLDILETSHTQGIQGILHSKVTSKICAHFAGIHKLTEFLELCQVCLCQLLSRDDIVVENEMEVLKSAVAWVKYNTNDRVILLETVFSYIRLANISSVELVKLGQDIPILMENDNIRIELLKAHWNNNSVELKIDSKFDDKPCSTRKYIGLNRKAVSDSAAMPSASKTSAAGKAHDKSAHKQSDSPSKAHGIHSNNNNSIIACLPGTNSTLDCLPSTKASLDLCNEQTLDFNVLNSARSSQFSEMSTCYYIPKLSENQLQFTLEVEKTNAMLQIQDGGDATSEPTNSVKALSQEDMLELDPFPVKLLPENIVTLYFTAPGKMAGQVRLKAFDTASAQSRFIETGLPEDVMGHQVVYGKPYVYIVGGSPTGNAMPKHIQPLNSVWRMHEVTRAWTQMSPMISERYFCCAVIVNNRLYAIGGVNRSMTTLKSMEALDLKESELMSDLQLEQSGVVMGASVQYEKTWRAYSDMPYPRVGAAACVHNTTIYVAGGATRLGNLTDDALRSTVTSYDTTTDTWCRLSQLRRPRFRAAMTVYGDVIYVVGGMTSADRYRFARHVEALDIQGDADWKKAGSVKCRRVGGACGTNGHKLFLTGGLVYTGKESKPEERAETEVINLLPEIL